MDILATSICESLIEDRFNVTEEECGCYTWRRNCEFAEAVWCKKKWRFSHVGHSLTALYRPSVFLNHQQQEKNINDYPCQDSVMA